MCSGTLRNVSKSKEEAISHFGWLAHFAGLDIPAAAALTRQQSGWTSSHPGLIADLENGTYFEK